MSDKKQVNVQGTGLEGALFITFLVLKLTEVIDWSWWWVTAPLWIPLVLVAALFVVIFTFLCGVGALQEIAANRRARKARQRMMNGGKS